MKCAWESLLAVLPGWLRPEVDNQGRGSLQELRLRLGKPPELVFAGKSLWLRRCIGQDDLNFCVNTASQYSPWAAQSVHQGYLTAQGGHRIGICGEAVMQNGLLQGIRKPESLCIRVARDFPGIGEAPAKLRGNTLLIGPPGSGKTTLLRDIARQISGEEAVAVVDERGELFPPGLFDGGQRLDVLRGCPKKEGIMLALRTMGPATIAVDEITAREDCEALVQAGWCGVRLLATVHAGTLLDLRTRELYRPLWESGLFQHFLVLDRYKNWHEERMTP